MAAAERFCREVIGCSVKDRLTRHAMPELRVGRPAERGNRRLDGALPPHGHRTTRPDRSASADPARAADPCAAEVSPPVPNVDVPAPAQPDTYPDQGST